MRNPDIHLDEHFYNAMALGPELLDSGKTDALITNAQPDRQSGICCELLFQDRFVLMVPEKSPLLDKALISMEDIKNCTFVLPYSARNTCPVQQFLQLATKAGISLEISLVPDVSAMEYFLKNSGYLTIASQATTLFFQFPNRFSVPMSGPEYVIPYYLIYL